VPEKNCPKDDVEGILLLNKPIGKTSFHMVATLRKKFGVRKIGHAGTLDPFATGVMVMLIGRNFTKLSDSFLCNDKEYVAEVKLGSATDTHDCDGEVIFNCPDVPDLEEVKSKIAYFQGEINQVPPMYSAKKVNGKKLYDLARKGIEIERKSVKIQLETHILSYNYPYLCIRVKCSKGTYIRCIAHELGQQLGCGGHLSALERIRSGQFKIENCIAWDQLEQSDKALLSQRLLCSVIR
jgi:tRNA pseudouridine55 synthase